MKCHGLKKQESGLRLDSLPAARKGGELAGPAINLDRPLQSPLLRAIRHEGDLAMPPQEKLSPPEIQAVTRWLQSGAPWPQRDVSPTQRPDPAEAWRDHWAARPVKPQRVPSVRAEDRVYTPLDAFVLANLEQAGIAGSPLADSRTLIRRAHFVLSGLPPTRDEIERFQAAYRDDPQSAMAELVDQLLASPHYGERWTRHWLDVARYADTKGYVRLNEQANFYYAYTYRDYVLSAFNNDLPYDQFVLEQLAADKLITGHDNRRLAALGFLTLGRRFTGNQHDIIDDRIDVVTRGLMGITVSCARCHDHKFDPIGTADYYSLYGMFASTSEPSDLPYLSRDAHPPKFLGAMTEYKAKRAELDALIDAYLPATLDMLRADTTRYLRGVLSGRKVFLVPLPAAKGELRQTFVERWVEYLEGCRRGTHPVFAAWHALQNIPTGEFPKSAVSVLTTLRQTQTASRLNPLVLRALAAADLASMTDVANVYGQLLESTHSAWQTAIQDDPGLTALPNEDREQLRQVLYGTDSPFAITPREALDAYLLDADWNMKLSKAYLDFDAWLIGTGKAARRAHVLLDSKRIHEPHVFIRGNPERTGQRVPRAAPRLLGKPLSAPFRSGSGRLELARAVVDPRNPFTARVIVNRVWKHHFGSGLFQTTSNIGLRGSPPTHPRLLDFLAQRFMEEGWSIKQLHRCIVLSSTWQQSSVDRADCREIDPANSLLWRANRRRIDFETLRDSLLMASGRLNLTVGGPSIPLTQADNVRRTLYGQINRGKLPKVLRLFDVASPDIHSPGRPQTTVPQQALYLLNNAFVIQEAQSLAGRARAAGNGTPHSTANHLYWFALGRPAMSEELKQCADYVADDPTAWAEIAQSLLVSNEFLFID